jgi:hypothetical protein
MLIELLAVICSLIVRDSCIIRILISSSLWASFQVKSRVKFTRSDGIFSEKIISDVNSFTLSRALRSFLPKKKAAREEKRSNNPKSVLLPCESIEEFRRIDKRCLSFQLITLFFGVEAAFIARKRKHAAGSSLVLMTFGRTIGQFGCLMRNKATRGEHSKRSVKCLESILGIRKPFSCLTR